MSARHPDGPKPYHAQDADAHAAGVRMDRLEARIAGLERLVETLVRERNELRGGLASIGMGGVAEHECTDGNGCVIPGGPR